MTMSTLMCPHCGGRLLVDPTQRLQSMLSCPYCGRKSLMQKINGMIVLRGIISQITPPGPWNSDPSSEPSTEAQAPSDNKTTTGDFDNTEETEAADLASDADNDLDYSGAADVESTDDVQKSSPEATLPDDAQTTAMAEETEGTELEPDTGTPDKTTVLPEDEPIQNPINDERMERLIIQAIQAASSGEMPAFNSYSRQAIDCDPTDPRMYAVRARLIEEAHGFARATYLSPAWADQTPRQKTWAIAQHFISLNAAVAYSDEESQRKIASESGALIAWQIRETFVENAQLRLGKRPFNGRFHRRDLKNAAQVIDACARINDLVVPHISGHLLRAIRLELENLDPRLSDQMQRIGF